MKEVIIGGLKLFGMLIGVLIFIIAPLVLSAIGIINLANNYSQWFHLLFIPYLFLFCCGFYYTGTRWGDMPRL